MNILFYRELFNSSKQVCENELFRNFYHPIRNLLVDDQRNNFNPIKIGCQFVKLDEVRIDGIKILKIRTNTIIIKVNWNIIFSLKPIVSNKTWPRDDHHSIPLEAALTIEFKNGNYSKVSIPLPVEYPNYNSIYVTFSNIGLINN